MKGLLPIVLGLLAAAAIAQEDSASRPASINLPVADHAKPFDAKDAIVVEVFRAIETPAGAENEVAREWQFRLGDRTYGADKTDVAFLGAALRAAALSGVASETRLSDRALLIRADAEAPHACIATVIGHATAARIYRAFFAIVNAGGEEQALAWPIPVDAELRVRVAAGGTRILLRWFQELGRPTPGRVIVTMAEGISSQTILDDDKDLAKALTRETSQAPVLIDAEARVPWQRVVDVINAAHGAGRKQIDFALGAALNAGGLIGSGVPRRDRPGTAPGGESRIGRRNAQAGKIQATEKCVMAGLEWLRRHQSPDGSWDCDGFSTVCDKERGAACTGGGQFAFDTGATGLALLAFLGAGYDSQRPGPYLDTVRNGLKFLKSNQDAQGCFGPNSDDRHTYAHACATIAMCEAFGATKQLPWRKSGEQAVAYINACQKPDGSWRYGKQPRAEDASVTGWMLMALRAAKDAGIPIDEARAKAGLTFLDVLTDGPVTRPEGSAAKRPATESLAAIAMCSGIFWSAADKQSMNPGAELLRKKVPVWDAAKGSIDMDYWYWGSLVMFQLGGADWERWSKSLEAAAFDNQVKKGCAEGSWDPAGPFGAEGGRVYSTALMALCLDTYFRYPKRQ